MPDRYDTSSAIAMLDLFESVGATAFDVTWLDIEPQGKPPFEFSRTVTELRRSMEWRLAEATAGQQSLIVRPRSNTTLFVQLDDLTTEQAAGLERYAFLTLRTSPGNCQVWLAVSDGPRGKEEAKQFRARVRRAVGAVDGNASGATRIAGSLNFKRKYAPNFPRVQIGAHADGRLKTVAELEQARLIAPEVAERRTALLVLPFSQRRNRPRAWPDYQRALRDARPKSDGSPNRSGADFFWCFLAIKWGWSVQETAGKLLGVSEKAGEQVRKGNKRYAVLTAENAAAEVERERIFGVCGKS